MAGRGFGKSRTGAELVRYWAESGVERIAMIAPTAADCRDVMVEGPSGVLTGSPPWNRPEYTPSNRRLTWKNGSVATLFSADEPDRLNGPQFSRAWCDEIGVWRYARDAWDMLQMGLRMGAQPRQVVTTTPKVQNISLIKQIMNLPSTVTTTGSTFENRDNLSKSFIETILDRYENTRLGQQELYARILDDVPGALWMREDIEKHRVKKHVNLTRIVVAIDPAVTNTEESDETGLIVAGKGVDGHGYVLSDNTLKASPKGWGQAAISLYDSFKADRIIAEVNNGGEMVEHVLRSIDLSVPYKAVHASRGKRVRAEPISAMYEQGKIHHVGIFPQLEDQMCSFTPDTEESPDRVDALVWAMTDLMCQDDSGWGSFEVRDR